MEYEECPPEMMLKEEEQPCEGHWGPWSVLSECSATCGRSVQTKSRNCDNPTPMEESKQCLLSNQSRGLHEDFNIDCDLEPCIGKWHHKLICVSPSH